MKLSGRNVTLELFNKIKEVTENAGLDRISLTLSEINKLTGISTRSIKYALSYLEIADTFELNRRKGAGTYRFIIDNNKIPNQDDIDLAAVAYVLYSKAIHGRKLVRAKKNNSLSPNLLLIIYFIINYIKTNNISLLGKTIIKKFLDEAVEITLLDNDLVKINHYILNSNCFDKGVTIYNDATYNMTNTHLIDDEDIIEFNEYHVHYWALESIYNFIHEKVKIDELINDLQTNGLTKVRKDDYVENMYRKADKEIEADIVSVKKPESGNYNFYKLLKRKNLLFNKVLNKEQKKAYAKQLYIEMYKQLELYATSDSYRNYMNSILYAAISGLIFGLVPYSISVGVLTRYLNIMKSIITDRNAYITLHSKLMDIDTRYNTLKDIYDMILTIWDHIAEGKSAISDHLLKYVEEKSNEKDYTKAEQRLIMGIDKIIKTNNMYLFKLEQMFENPESFSLKKFIKKEYAELNNKTLIYHNVLYLLTTTDKTNFSYHERKMFEKNIEFVYTLSSAIENLSDYIKGTLTIDDLKNIDFKENLKTLFKASNVRLKEFKRYTDTIYQSTINELYDEMIDNTTRLDNVKKTIMKVMLREIVELTDGRIWQFDLIDIAEKIANADAKLAYYLINQLKLNHSAYERQYRGYKFARAITYILGVEEIQNPRILYKKLEDEINEYLEDYKDDYEIDFAELLKKHNNTYAELKKLAKKNDISEEEFDVDEIMAQLDDRVAKELKVALTGF
jgi:hypothetical protein